VCVCGACSGRNRGTKDPKETSFPWLLVSKSNAIPFMDFECVRRKKRKVEREVRKVSPELNESTDRNLRPFNLPNCE